MSDRGSLPQSATDLLRSTIHHLPRISLREAREADQTPVHRPPAPPHTIPKGETPWPERIGPYHIAGEIAHGGMGTILKARDIDLGRDVALKVLHGDHRDKPEVLRRFIEEAQIASQLQHPGVVSVHGMGLLPDGLPYFVMKLVKGRTLAAVMEERRDPRDDRQRLLGIFEQVCQAVAYAHARQVVHRDLKPSNIMIGAFGEVQVMDWGLAKVLSRERPAAAGAAPEAKSIIATIRSGSGSSQSLAGSVLGTPAYMAPEQARGELDQVDSRSDVFGLGAILCEMLTGKPPYVAETLEEIYHKARKGYLDEAFVRLADCQAAGELVALARRSLAYEPRERPADASAIAREVRGHLDSLEARTRRLGVEAAEVRARISEERRSRRLGLVLCAAAAVLVATAGTSWLWIQGVRDRREAAATRLAEDGYNEATVLHGEARGAKENLARWEAAVAAAQEADRRAAGGATPAVATKARSLRGQIEVEAAEARASAERDQRKLDMTGRLQRIAQDSEQIFLIGSGYRHAFRDFGIDIESLPPEESARRIRESGLPTETAASALTAWARLKRWQLGQDSSGWKLLIEVADRADPDPLRAQLRRAWGLDSPASLPELYRLAAEARRLDLPTATSELLGDTLTERGAEAVALGVLTRARNRSPQSPALYLSLRQVDRTSFLSYMIAMAALLPQDFWVFDNLGHAYAGGNGTSREALPWFEEALRRHPTSAHLLGYVGLFLGGLEKSRSADVGRASRFFREAFRLDPWNGGNHHNYGWVLENSGDQQGALREYREELRIRRDNGSLNNLGYLLKGQGDLDGALAVWSEVLRRGGLGSRFAYNLRIEVASILAGRGELAAAEHHLRKAHEQDFSNWASRRLASMLARQGRLLEAIPILQRSIELDPSSQDLVDALSIFTDLRLPPPGDPTFEPLRQTLLALAESIEGAVLSGMRVLPGVRDLLLRAHEARIEVLSPSEAFAEAHRTASRHPEVAEFVALEALGRWMKGEKKQAIGLLEKALRWAGEAPHLARRLEARRAEVRPDLLTFASIDAALESPVPLLRQGDAWRFFRGKTAPSPALEWTRNAFDDSGWESGPSGFGYGDDDDATNLTDMLGQYTSVLIRRKVELPAGGKWERVELRVVSDDGFVAFVNGEEAGRFRAPAGAQLTVSSQAQRSHEADVPEVIDVTGLVRPGENLLALQGLNDTLGSSDFSLIPELWMLPAKDQESGRTLLESLRAAARGDDAPARLAYLEGRLHERAGRPAEALAAFERAGAASPRDPEPLERVVAVLDAQGRGAEVRPRLEAGFRAGVSASGGLLRRWASPPEGPKPGLAEILTGFPLRADPYPVVLLPRSSQKEGLAWRFADQRAPEGWERDGFDDSKWSEGRAPFGNVANDLFQPVTPWLTPDLWIRRELELDLPDSIPERLRLTLTVLCCHDDDAEVYLNGVEIARFEGWSQGLYAERSHRGALPLRKGRNLVAVHCHNGGGGSALDLELILRIVTGER